ncbi:MAG: hypothetical protein AABW84_02075 [Nanoarchaeota archaeon]
MNIGIFLASTYSKHMMKAKKELTVKEILELIEAVEKAKKATKKLAEVFGMPLDELLKSSKKVEDRIDVLKKKERKPESLLEQITETAPKDLKNKSKEVYDPKYKSSNELYQQDQQYVLQTDEKESGWQYDSQIKKKKRNQL